MEIKEFPFTRLNLKTSERYSPIPGDFTSLQNVEIDENGSLTRRSGFTKYNTTAIASYDVNGLYGYFISTGGNLLIGAAGGTLKEVSAAGAGHTIESGLSAESKFDFVTYLDTLYYCNGTNANKRYVGPTGTPVEMGLPEPTDGLLAAQGVAGNVPVGYYYYRVSFVYSKYGESNVYSAVGSEVQVTTDAKQVDLTSIPLGGTGCTARRIYRCDTQSASVSDPDSLAYYLIDQVDDNTTTTYADNFQYPEYGFPAPLDNNTPPAYFTKMCVYQERLFAIDGSSKVYWSDTGYPDIWPISNYGYVGRDDGDIALGFLVLAGRLYVFKSRSTWVLLGQSLDTYRFEPLISKGCSFPHTICSVGGNLAFFLSQEGGYLFNGADVQLITEDIQSEIEDMIQRGLGDKFGSEGSAVFWDNKLYLFLRSSSATTLMQGWTYSLRRNMWIGGPHTGIEPYQFYIWKGVSKEDILYFGSADGFLYKFDTGVSDGGADIASKITFKITDLGYPERKLLYRLRFQVNLGGTTLYCTVTTDKGQAKTTFPLKSDTSGYMIWGKSIWAVATWGGAGTEIISKMMPYNIAGDYFIVEFSTSDQNPSYRVHQLLGEYYPVRVK